MEGPPLILAALTSPRARTGTAPQSTLRPIGLGVEHDIEGEGHVKRRVLGGTGMSVSEFALGTMMLGAMGNTDHDESVRIIHTALDTGINVVDTADVHSRG